MDGFLLFLYLIAFVISVIMIVAQFQLFAIRRLLEKLVEVTTPRTVVESLPMPDIPSPPPSIAVTPSTAKVYKPNWTMVIIAAVVVVVGLVALIAVLGSGSPK